MSQDMDRRGFIGFAIAMTAGCTLAAVLAGCTPGRQSARTTPFAVEGVERVSRTTGDYSQCVPYARDNSGIQIYGDAWTWWSKANGRYDRGQFPRRGAVLTLRKTDRLTAGHVAVVASVIDSRRILVDHANWGDNPSTRGKIHTRQPVIDVSAQNDWSVVRFMNTQGSFGANYPAYGFIYSDAEIRTADSQTPGKR